MLFVKRLLGSAKYYIQMIDLRQNVVDEHFQIDAGFRFYGRIQQFVVSN
jgi:hypothetical protein